MSSVTAILNNKMALREKVAMVKRAKIQLAREKIAMEKCAKHLPVIQAYLEKQGLGLDSLYSALGRAGEFGMAHRGALNTIGAGAVGAGLGAGAGALAGDKEHRGRNALLGALGGGALGAGGFAAAKHYAPALAEGGHEAMKRNAQLEQLLSTARNPAEVSAIRSQTGMGRMAQLRNTLQSGVGRAAGAVERFDPAGAASEGLRSLRARPQMQARLKAKQRGGEERVAKSESRKEKKRPGSMSNQEWTSADAEQ